jgi:hypothetical protein
VTSPTCVGFVRINRHVRPCVTTPKVQRDGHWYCGWHDPIAVEARQAPAGDKAAIARLQDAAPDLLAAASLANLHFQRALASGQDLGDDEHEAWTALRAAIAKAGGK